MRDEIYTTLSTRALNCLVAFGYLDWSVDPPQYSREKIRADIESGRLTIKPRRWCLHRNYGRKTEAEVRRFVGLPE